MHRVIVCNKQPWMNRYIDFNMNRRKEVKNGFKREVFDLINKSVFGKITERG